MPSDIKSFTVSLQPVRLPDRLTIHFELLHFNLGKKSR